jgi:hypothetical protein
MVRLRLTRHDGAAPRSLPDGRNCVKALKKFFRKVKKKLSPLMLIPIVVLVLILGGGYLLFFAGDEDDNGGGSASNSSTLVPTNPKPSNKTPKRPKLKPDDPAGGTEFTIDSDRDEKTYALAQATGSITEPQTIGLRVGAAPKQPVTVNWNIVCLLADEGAKSTDDTFTATPPFERQLKLPVNNAVTCTASANAQLTQAGRGRIKVFLVGVRRVGAD